MADVILIVDDDPVLRAAVAGQLRDAGYSVVEAGSAAAALAMLTDTPIDGVLLDQSMPGPPGIELAARIRGIPRYERVPVLFLSADDTPETRLAALRSGATDFMVKPFPMDEIVARMESQLQLSARWASTVSGLQTRAGIVAELAALGSDLNPAVLSRRICERISSAHGGTAVAVFSWLDRSGEPVMLASSGPGPDVFTDAGPLLALRGESGPWIERLGLPSGRPGRSGSSWVVYCPMHRPQGTVGVLVLDGNDQPPEELLAAGVDYAPTVALLLGHALSETHRARRSRDLVERTLASRAYEAVFQPIVQIADGQVLGYEALTRLSSGDPVVNLLAEASEAGMRPECEICLLREALHQARALSDTWVSVNLSPSVVVDRSDQLASLIRESGCQVVIELTENERIEDYVSVREALRRLGERVRLSVDDTGAGYASLRHVIDLHPHFLKLDRSWISGLDGDETRRALVAGMVAFCRHTDTEMIAEGVETESELETLRRLDVRLAQGYLLGRPAALREAGSTTRT
jgi:EAL domain-containing protein (putative c-di-GMP-specific phosphodiesterase class I)/CheY-like chemotaxis protein